MPLVSIGLPVYQGAAYISNALKSLCAQSYSKFELIISDNASTDDTSKICQAYANIDNRITYIKHEQNQGAASNFKFVLNIAKGDFFFWAAHDDSWSTNFIETNLNFLISNNEYIASISPVRFEDGNFEPLSVGDMDLIGMPCNRFAIYLSCWHSNSLFYSLFRTEDLKLCPYLGMDFLGSDWAIMLYVIKRGKFHRSSRGFLLRGHQGFSNSGKILRHYRRKFIHWFMPFYELSVISSKLSDCFSISSKYVIFRSLLNLNWIAFKSSRIQDLLALKFLLNKQVVDWFNSGCS